MQTTPNQATLTGFRKWLPLMVLSLALFIIVLDSTIINVSMKTIIHDLHSNLKAVQWTITGYSLVLAAFTITGGRLGDALGRKRMFTLGAIVFGVGSLFASQAHSSKTLFLSVAVVEGLGAAMMLPSTASLILSEYHDKDRSLAFGVYGAIAGVAATVGPLLGGWLTSNYSWRWNYLINPGVVIVLLLGSVAIREAQARRTDRLDLPSILLSALGLAGVVAGIIESSTYGWLKAKTDFTFAGHAHHLGGISICAYIIALGLALLGLFLWRQARLEQRGQTPLVALDLFRNRQFTSGTSVILVMVMAQFGLIFVLPVFLQGLLGLDAFHTGLAILPFSLSILISSPLSAIMASRRNVPPRYLVQLGLALAVVGSILTYRELTVTSTAGSLAPGLAFFGFGFGLALAQLSNLTLSAIALDQAGEASGVNNTSRQLGTSLGQALIGALLISSIISQLNQDITASRLLPAAIKAPVAQAATVSLQSLGATTPDSAAMARLPRPIVAEITRIRNDAIVHGARAGMLATMAIASFALLLTPWLPRRPRPVPRSASSSNVA